MQWLRFSNESIVFLIQFILNLVITIALLRVKNKSTPTKLLAVALASSSFVLFGIFMFFSIWGPISFAFSLPIWFSVLFCGIFAVQFAYRFPSEFRLREAKAALIVSVVLCAVGTGLMIYGTRQYFMIANGYDFNETIQQIPPLFFLLEMIWFNLTLLRQTIHLSEEEIGSETIVSGKTGIKKSLLKLVKPQGRKAKASRALALPSLIPLFTIVLILLHTNKIISAETYLAGISLPTMLLFFLFVRFYLSNSPEPTTIRDKLMLSTVTLVLCVLAITGSVMVSRFEKVYNDQRLSEVESVKKAVLFNAQMPKTALAVVSRPLSPPDSASAAFNLIFSRDAGFDLKRFNEMVAEERRKRISKRIEKLLGQNIGADAAADAAAKEIDGSFWTIEVKYTSAAYAQRIGDGYYDRILSFPFVEGGRMHQVWFSYSDYRDYIHQGVTPLIYLIPTATLIVVIVVPLFLTTLVKPIDSLLEGVKEIDRGNLNAAVPVLYPDELGRLAGSFNSMAARLRNLIGGLEEQVAERTAQLESRKMELEKQNQELAKKHDELVQSYKKVDLIFSALANALPGTTLDGKYRLDEKIGEGGFGAVYKAEHLGIHKPVAVKIFRPAGGIASREGLLRFQLEAISTCRVNHPNAVSVLDSGISSEGIAYLVMELLIGRPLRDELRMKGILSPERCAEILLPICDVLAKAHESGIIHRDVKPENIFLHNAPEGEMVKVVDFGIAKLQEDSASVDIQSLTAAGSLLGTPLYMCPERLDNKPYDGRADVYSVGVMLYEMLCGRVPFEPLGNNPFSLIYMHLSKAPRPLTELNPNLSKEIEAVVLQSLEKDPERRPTARELARMFGEVSGFEPKASIGYGVGTATFNIAAAFDDSPKFAQETVETLEQAGRSADCVKTLEQSDRSDILTKRMETTDQDKQ